MICSSSVPIVTQSSASLYTGAKSSLGDRIWGEAEITADSDYSHEVKRCLLLERKTMTNLDCILKSKENHFADRGQYSQSYGFSSSHAQMWELDHKKGHQLSRSVVSDSLRPHGLQHAKPPCPSPTPGAYSNSCTLSRWCDPTISSSVIPFSSCLQSFPTSGSFQMSQLFTGGGQSIGVSASASVLPMNIQDWFPLGWTGWISLLSKGLSRVFSNTTVQKHQFFGVQFSLQSNSHIHTWLLKKP